MDFSKYKIRMNVKSICLFEQMTGQNFFIMRQDEDTLKHLMYAVIVTNNPELLMTYDAFNILLEDKKFAKWIEIEMNKIAKFSSQFQFTDNDPVSSEVTGDILKMTEIGTCLIVQYGVDAHYVMYELNPWEIIDYFKAADRKKKGELVEQRLWTYLTIMPHIDSKKLRSPEQLLPFEWEKKETKERSKNKMNKEMDIIKAVFKKEGKNE